jgi:hypothetical protein
MEWHAASRPSTSTLLLVVVGTKEASIQPTMCKEVKHRRHQQWWIWLSPVRTCWSLERLQILETMARHSQNSRLGKQRQLTTSCLARYYWLFDEREVRTLRHGFERGQILPAFQPMHEFVHMLMLLSDTLQCISWKNLFLRRSRHGR